MKNNIFEDQLYYESAHCKTEFLMLLQRMIDDDILQNCSKKTFQLLCDIISSKRRLKKGRPRGLSSQGFSIWLAVSDEMNKPGMIRKQAIGNVAKGYNQ